MSTAFVTGAGGFVGKYLCHELVSRGWKVVALLHHAEMHPEGVFDDSPIKGLPSEVFVVTGDLLDPSTWRKAVSQYKVDAVFHLAGQSFVPNSLKNPQHTFNLNFSGSRILLDAFGEMGFFPPKFLMVSSSDVYGFVKKEELPLLEERPTLHPRNPYSLSKAAMELMALDYCRSHRFRVCVARSFAHIGAGQANQFVVPAFASRIAKVENELDESKRVIKVGSLHAVKDYLHVKDVVAAYISLMESDAPSDVYNICSGNECSIQSLLDGLIAKAKNSIKTETDPELVRPDEDTAQCYHVGSNAKLTKATGWAPKFSLGDALEDVLNYERGRA